MICSKCKAENAPGAKFCYSCGSPLKIETPVKKSTSSATYKVFNILFWIAAVVAAYSFISLAFPLKSTRTVGWDAYESEYYIDPLQINGDGREYYYEEWAPVLIIAAIAGVGFFLLRRKYKNK